jgi:hypothetical protein
MRVVVLIGFDRSGTSYVAGVLEEHPDVKYFCQPDNSSPLHRAQWEFWTPGDGDAASNHFLRELVGGRIDREYVVSDWFKRFGCGEYELDARRLNLVKSTKLHLKVRWLEQFPTIEVGAILRDPRASIASLVRNGFHEKWYGARDYAAARALLGSGVLPDTGLDLSSPGDAPTSVEAMAWLYLVRTAVLCADLGWDRARMVFYEEARRRPSEYLCSALRLPLHDLDRARARDFNIIGDPFVDESHGWRTLTTADRHALQRLLGPLIRRLGYPEELA